MSYHLQNHAQWNASVFVSFHLPCCPSVSTRRSNPSNKFPTTYDFYYRVQNLKSILILAFLLLIPSCGIHYPWLLRSANSLGAFRKLLKSGLFDLALPPDQQFFLVSGWFLMLMNWNCPPHLIFDHCALNTLNVDRAHYKTCGLDQIQIAKCTTQIQFV